MEEFESNPIQIDMSDITYFTEFFIGECYTDEYLGVCLSTVGPKVILIPPVWELWGAVQEPDSAVSSVHHQNP